MALLATCFTLDFCLAYSSTLKMEATFSSGTSVDFQQAVRCYIPDDKTVHWIVTLNKARRDEVTERKV
jgi:hypothetical protein